MGSSGGGTKQFAERATYNRALAKAEAEIRYKAAEHLVVMDKDGNVILEKDGERTSIEVTEREARLLKGASVTHNHPGGTTFSPDDIGMAVDYGIKELRAVGDDGSTYTLLRKASLFVSESDRQRFYTDFSKIAKKAFSNCKPERKAAKEDYLAGRITAQEYRERAYTIDQQWSSSLSRWLRKNAENYGYEYRAEYNDKDAVRGKLRAR